MKVVAFFKHLVVLFVIKQTVEWKKKPYTSLRCCCFKTALPTSINFVYIKLRNLSPMLNLPKEKWIWLTRPQGFPLFLFNVPDVKKKKKLDPPPGMLICRWKMHQRNLGDMVTVSVETLPPRDPIFLIGSNYPPFSIAAFQWSHLLWGPSVRGSVVVDY